MAEANNQAGPTTIFCFSCGAVMERAAGFCLQLRDCQRAFEGVRARRGKSSAD